MMSESSPSEIRVRFAPSPTGYLHVGGARTALYDYLFAKNKKGKFILRVEDTDQARSTEEALKLQVEDLNWLGLNWDEGPDPSSLEDKGDYGPYRQSQRLDIYKTHLEKLLAEEKAFYCFMSDEENEKLKQEAIAKGLPGQVNSPYRDMPKEEAAQRVQSGEKAVIRFRVPDETKTYKIDDMVRGEVEFPSSMVGDFVLMRSDGMPVYNFCCVVDDALMKISHVFRAEEHLSNTLRQLMLYEAFAYEIPVFGHVSIILGSDKQKLSKRHGATSVGQYRERGYLPAALNNFLSLLGWSPSNGEEIQSLESLIEQFDGSRLHASSAVFDEVKLKWVNATHLRALSSEDLWTLVEPKLKEKGLDFQMDHDWSLRSVDVFKSYMETLEDAVELYRPLAEFEIVEEAKEVLKWTNSSAVIKKWAELVEQADREYLSEEDFNSIQNQVKLDCQVKGKDLFMPIRTAIIGKPHGAELKILVPLLKTSKLIDRANKALSFC